MKVSVDGYMLEVKDPETQILLEQKHLRSLANGYGFVEEKRILPNAFNGWIEVLNYLASMHYAEEEFTYYYKCHMEDEFRFWSCKVSTIAIQAFKELKKIHLDYVELMTERIKLK